MSIEITKDEYFTRKQPAKSEELKNRIEVLTQPLLPASAAEELYSTGEVIELDNGESLDVVAYYSTQPALLTGTSISKSDETGGTLTLSTPTYYAWGAEFTISNSSGSTGSCNVTIEAIPLRVSGEETIVAEDSESQVRYGVQKYVVKTNHLIQNSTVAGQIAEKLLDSYKTYRKDVTVTWRGNPQVELGDTMYVPEYQRGAIEVPAAFKITKNKTVYDGTLKQTTDGRKIESTLGELQIIERGNQGDPVYTETGSATDEVQE